MTIVINDVSADAAVLIIVTNSETLAMVETMTTTTTMILPTAAIVQGSSIISSFNSIINRTSPNCTTHTNHIITNHKIDEIEVDNGIRALIEIAADSEADNIPTVVWAERELTSTILLDRSSSNQAYPQESYRP